MSAQKPDLADLQDEDVAKGQAKEQAAVQAAVTVAGAAGDPRHAAARQAELDRQQAVVDAVAAANADELPALGGPIMEPGLGR